MNEQINSAAELDALPVGSVVARLHNDGHGNSVYTLTDEGWRAATEPMRPGVGPVFDQDDERMADLTVLYRPDQPQRVQPSREDVARVLIEHRTCVFEEAEPWRWACVCGHVVADRDGFTAGLLTRPPQVPAVEVAHAHHAADAVLALLAQQPTVAEVARKAWARGYSDAMEEYGNDDPLPPNPYVDTTTAAIASAR